MELKILEKDMSSSGRSTAPCRITGAHLAPLDGGHSAPNPALLVHHLTLMLSDRKQPTAAPPLRQSRTKRNMSSSWESVTPVGVKGMLGTGVRLFLKSLSKLLREEGLVLTQHRLRFSSQTQFQFGGLRLPEANTEISELSSDRAVCQTHPSAAGNEGVTTTPKPWVALQSSGCRAQTLGSTCQRSASDSGIPEIDPTDRRKSIHTSIQETRVKTSRRSSGSTQQLISDQHSLRETSRPEQLLRITARCQAYETFLSRSRSAADASEHFHLRQEILCSTPAGVLELSGLFRLKNEKQPKRILRVLDRTSLEKSAFVSGHHPAPSFAMVAMATALKSQAQVSEKRGAQSSFCVGSVPGLGFESITAPFESRRHTCTRTLAICDAWSESRGEVPLKTFCGARTDRSGLQTKPSGRATFLKLSSRSCAIESKHTNSSSSGSAGLRRRQECLNSKTLSPNTPRIPDAQKTIKAPLTSGNTTLSHVVANGEGERTSPSVREIQFESCGDTHRHHHHLLTCSDAAQQVRSLVFTHRSIMAKHEASEEQELMYSTYHSR
ncbi:hypothetical protein DNTS_032797 [Danionella cerebrum]|uniref:Uncharacterized protein n=1 Tax=Danionella cerebrum TaxID=2873325 RepID=A0A553R4N5_9TELE|nr:hypothetical protein DNTS_032797 [Danionella translucida]